MFRGDGRQRSNDSVVVSVFVSAFAGYTFGTFRDKDNIFT